MDNCTCVEEVRIQPHRNQFSGHANVGLNKFIPSAHVIFSYCPSCAHVALKYLHLVSALCPYIYT